MIVRIMSVEAGAISLGVEMRPTAGSVNAGVVTSTFGTISAIDSEMTIEGQTSPYLVQLLKFEVRCPLCQCLP